MSDVSCSRVYWAQHRRCSLKAFRLQLRLRPSSSTSNRLVRRTDIFGVLATGLTEMTVISGFLAPGLRCPNPDTFGPLVTGVLGTASIVGTAVIGVPTWASMEISTIDSAITDPVSTAAGGRATSFGITQRFGT